MDMRLLIVVSQLFHDVVARVLPGFFFLVIVALSSGEFGVQVLWIPFRGDKNWVSSFGWGLALAALCYMFGWVFSGFVRKSLEGPTHEQARAKSVDSQLKAGDQVKSLEAMCRWVQSIDPAVGFRLVKLKAEVCMLETSRVAMTFVFGVVVVQTLVTVYTEAESRALVQAHVRDSGPHWESHVIRLCLALVVAFVLRAGFQRREKRAWEDYWDSIVGSYETLHEDTTG